MGTRLPHRRRPHTLGTRTHTTRHHRQRRPVHHHHPHSTSRGHHDGDYGTTHDRRDHAQPTFSIPHDHTRGDDNHSVSTTIGDPHHTPGDNAQTMSTTIADDDVNTHSRPHTGSTPSDHGHSPDDAESAIALPDTGHSTPHQKHCLPNSRPIAISAGARPAAKVPGLYRQGRWWPLRAQPVYDDLRSGVRGVA